MSRTRDFGLGRLLVVYAVFMILGVLIGCGGAVNGFDNGDDGAINDSTGALDGRAEAASSRDGSGPDVASDGARLDATADVVDGARADAAAPDAVTDAIADVADARGDVREAAADVADATVAEAASPDATADAADEGVGADAGSDAIEEIPTTPVDTGVEDAQDANDAFVALPPDPPTGVVAVAGNAAVAVSWTAPNDHGRAITQYSVTVSSNLGTATVTTNGATSVMVPSLVNGTVYSFTVTATNGAGTSNPSSPAVTATPAAVPDAMRRRLSLGRHPQPTERRLSATPFR
jgi:hypothetical protein